MRILVVGSGAREDALAWRLHSEGIEIFSTPGNPGTARWGENIEGPPEEAARRTEPDLVVIGPEEPLAAGLADHLRAAGLDLVGPSREAAMLEASKAFGKEIMASAGIPTARYLVAAGPEEGMRAIDELGGDVVVKADGLAGGKGTFVDDPEQGLKTILEEERFGPTRAIIEERLRGIEASVMALTDGEGLVFLPPALDYKRLLEGDGGPNTGGMGAVAPHPGLDGEAMDEIEERIFNPLLTELRRRGIEYRGFLYAGLIMTADGPAVLEWNVRPGDPETQAILAIIEEDGLAPVCSAAAKGELGTANRRIPYHGSAVAVVLAEEGYPREKRECGPIIGIEEAEALPGLVVFHASTRWKGRNLFSSGGRVLTVVGMDHETTYRAAGLIDFPGKMMRTDIGPSVS